VTSGKYPLVHTGKVRALGHRLHYVSFGPPKKGTLLVLHGGPGHCHTYLLPHLDLAPLGYRVVLYDQLGCGESDRDPSGRDYTFDHAAEEVEAVRRGLKLGRVHLLGHSYGTALAVEAAARYPRSFRSLILAGGIVAPREVVAREQDRLVRALPTSVRRPISRPGLTINDVYPRSPRGEFRAAARWYREWGRRHVYRGEYPPWELVLSEQYLNNKVNPPTWASLRNWKGSGKPHDVSKLLPRIHVPCLVTVGRYDQCTVGISRYTHRHLSNSRLVIFEKSSHMPHFEERDRYVAVLRRFLDSI